MTPSAPTSRPLKNIKEEDEEDDEDEGDEVDELELLATSRRKRSESSSHSSIKAEGDSGDADVIHISTQIKKSEVDVARMDQLMKRLGAVMQKLQNGKRDRVEVVEANDVTSYTESLLEDIARYLLNERSFNKAVKDLNGASTSSSIGISNKQGGEKDLYVSFLRVAQEHLESYRRSRNISIQEFDQVFSRIINSGRPKSTKRRRTIPKTRQQNAASVTVKRERQESVGSEAWDSDEPLWPPTFPNVAMPPSPPALNQSAIFKSSASSFASLNLPELDFDHRFPFGASSDADFSSMARQVSTNFGMDMSNRRMERKPTVFSTGSEGGSSFDSLMEELEVLAHSKAFDGELDHLLKESQFDFDLEDNLFEELAMPKNSGPPVVENAVADNDLLQYLDPLIPDNESLPCVVTAETEPTKKLEYSLSVTADNIVGLANVNDSEVVSIVIPNLSGIWKRNKASEVAIQNMRKECGTPWVLSKMFEFMEQRFEIEHTGLDITYRLKRKWFTNPTLHFYMDNRTHRWGIRIPPPFSQLSSGWKYRAFVELEGTVAKIVLEHSVGQQKVVRKNWLSPNGNILYGTIALMMFDEKTLQFNEIASCQQEASRETTKL